MHSFKLPFYCDTIFFHITFLTMHPLPQMNIVLDFVCIGSVELRGTQSKRKKNTKWKFLAHIGIQTDNIEIHSQTLSPDWTSQDSMKALVLKWHLCQIKVLYIEVSRVPDQVRVLGRVLHFGKQTQNFCVFFTLSAVDISPTCSTMQYMYGTKYVLLHLIMPRTYANIRNSCMYKCHLQKKSFSNTWLAKSVASLTRNLNLMGSSPTVGNFFFSYCIFCFHCNSSEPIQMQSGMTFIQGNRCIGRKIILKKMAVQ